MSRTLGIAIGHDRVRAVAVRRGRVAWAAEAPYRNAQDLAEVLAQLAES